jgi:hypothetical protein
MTRMSAATGQGTSIPRMDGVHNVSSVLEAELIVQGDFVVLYRVLTQTKARMRVLCTVKIVFRIIVVSRVDPFSSTHFTCSETSLASAAFETSQNESNKKVV